ncbi:MAG: 3-deoxy-manno-octulosonate cytidylyltransferase [Chlamydiae bacterium]|nr:3-deoxy-manno-octulosonate cytidylyltransferase [Chlamydiota bacterium]
MAQDPKTRILGMIPARFGSRRFPGKPLAMIAGKSLIQRTYENAKKCNLLSDLIVATDDKRIYDHVLGFDGQAVMTSQDCPTGTERLAEAVKNNNELSDTDIVVNIQGDEPFLGLDVIESVVNILQNAEMSTAVVPIHDEKEAYDPSVNKCVLDKQGYALYFSRTLIPNGHTGKWDPKITYYKHLGIYGYRKGFLLRYAELAPTPLQMSEDLEQLKVLEHGFRIKVAVVENDSVGIDTPEDIKKVEQTL